LTKLHAKRKLKNKIKRQLKVLLPHGSTWRQIETLIKQSTHVKIPKTLAKIMLVYKQLKSEICELIQETYRQLIDFFQGDQKLGDLDSKQLHFILLSISKAQ
jgi:hypothetical protein